MSNKIYVIGDSHTLNSFQDKFSINSYRIENENFISLHIGPRTAYKLENNKSLFLDKTSEAVDNVIISVFGEIDCRQHIHKKYTKLGLTIDELIDETAKRYITFLSNQSHLFKKVYVFNVQPTVKELGIVNTYRNILSGPAPEFIPRRTIIEKFNKALRYYCNKYDFTFLDIYDKLCDVDGHRKEDFNGNDTIHCNSNVSKVMLEEYPELKSYIEKV